MYTPNYNVALTWIMAIGGLAIVACSNKSERKNQKFEDIQPKHIQKPSKKKTSQDTLAPYLLKYTNDSVGFTFDAIKIDQTAHFLDRFPHPKGQYPTHFELLDGQNSIFVGEWKFKDSNTRVNAFFNWLDHYGAKDSQLEWFKRQKLSNENVLILINNTSIIEINSNNMINRKKWEHYQYYSNPEDSIRIIIEQRKGQLCRWTIPKSEKKQQLPQ